MTDDIDTLPLTDVEKLRIRMTVGCHDCDAIPKVADAGQVHEGSDGRFQVIGGREQLSASAEPVVQDFLVKEF